MSPVYREVISITTDAAGAGTATTTEPVVGEVLSVRYDGTAFGGTADFVITRQEAGGTILNLTDGEGPWEYAPRINEVTTAAGSIGVDALIPVSEYLVVTVAEGGSVVSDALHLFYRR